MRRYLETAISEDLKRKMVFVTGPRQVGKTTLAQRLGAQYKQPLYLNYDSLSDRKRIEASDWFSPHDYVVLDEIHSMPSWKTYLKGAFDSKPKAQALLVTGGAQLDTSRQAGESLAGRYFRARLHPFSVRELANTGPSEPALETLLRFGGFPEPLFAGTDAARRRWQNQYFTDLIREDVFEFSRIHEIRAMRELLELLRGRTGSPLSFESLSRDLAVSPNTVKSYVQILEALHIVFIVRPYHRNIARAMAKAPKLYFYDWAYVSDPGARFENLVACHLLKHVQYLSDIEGTQSELHYLRATDGKEIDFVLANESGEASHFVEVKLSDASPSFTLRSMGEAHPNAKAIQLVFNLKHASHQGNVEVVKAASWLNELAA